MKIFQPTTGSGGGGSGTVTAVSTSGSLTGGTITTSGTLMLVNDNATPGNNFYYGTDGSGTKGFFSTAGFSTNIYNSDGTLLGNRTLDGAGTFDLTMDNLRGFSVQTATSDINITSATNATITATLGNATLASSSASVEAGSGITLLSSGGADITSTTNGSFDVNVQDGINLNFAATPLSIDSDPGTDGDVLVSHGAGDAPTWVDPSIFAVNIYNADGTLLADRTLTGAGNDLTFTGLGAWTANTANDIKFNIAGSTDGAGFNVVAGNTELNVNYNNDLNIASGSGAALIQLAPDGSAQFHFEDSLSFEAFAGIDLDGTSGTEGQVFTSHGAAQPTWETAPAVNIYNSDGTLTGTRTVTGANNFLSFIGLAGFSAQATNISIANVGVGSFGNISLASTGSTTITAGGAGAASLNLQFTTGADLALQGSAGSNNQVLTTHGAGVAPTWESVSSLVTPTPPAAPDRSVQFNNSGAFGGSANFIWDTSKNLLFGDNITTGGSSSSLGFGVATGATINTGQSEGSLAFGFAQNSGVISADGGAGTFAFGTANDSGVINANADASFAFGSATSSGQIGTHGNGAFAMGRADGAGSIIDAATDGTFVVGSAQDAGQLLANSNGAFTHGIASGAGSTVDAEASGSFAGGDSSNGGTIIANGTGSIAHGIAADGFSINASAGGAFAIGAATGGGVTAGNTGAIAMGYALNADINSSGLASFAGGYANNGAITAGGPGDFVWGDDISTDGSNNVLFGSGYAISGGTTNNTFNVGWGLQQFVVNGDTSSIGLSFNTVGELDIDGDPGTAGDVLTSTGAGSAPIWAPASGGGGSPASPDRSIQFNNTGSFGGTADFIFDTNDNVLLGENATSSGAKSIVFGIGTGATLEAQQGASLVHGESSDFGVVTGEGNVVEVHGEAFGALITFTPDGADLSTSGTLTDTTTGADANITGGNGSTYLTLSGLSGTNWDNGDTITDGTNFATVILLQVSTIKAANNDAKAFGQAQNGGTIIAGGDASLAFGSADTSNISTGSTASMAFGLAQANSEINISGTASFGFGSVQNNSHIIASSDGAFAAGQVEGGGTIQAISSGAFAFGRIDNGLISSENEGTFVGGSVDTGTIKADSEGGFAWGRVEGGDAQIYSSAEGAFVYGWSGSDGILQADAHGATVFGITTDADSFIKAEGDGSFANGNTSSGGQIMTSGLGSFAAGHASGAQSSITAFADGSVAVGDSANGDSINANGVGSFAGGAGAGNGNGITTGGAGAFAFGYIANDQISSTGLGSVAMGWSNAGPVTASANGAFALGTNVVSSAENAFTIGNGLGASATRAFAIGAGFNNSVADSLNIGFTGIQLDIDSTGNSYFTYFADNDHQLGFITGGAISLRAADGLNVNGDFGMVHQVLSSQNSNNPEWVDPGLYIGKQEASPTSGSTVATSIRPQLILTPAGTLATLTVTFPSSPTDAQTFSIASTQTITSLTLGGGTILGTLTTLPANGFASWMYVQSITSWMRIG